MPTATRTPAHLDPTACYVCGSSGPHPRTAHVYWSNADAAAELAAEAARLSRPGYTEARYVATYRPY